MRWLTNGNIKSLILKSIRHCKTIGADINWTVLMMCKSMRKLIDEQKQITVDSYDFRTITVNDSACNFENFLKNAEKYGLSTKEQSFQITRQIVDSIYRVDYAINNIRPDCISNTCDKMNKVL